MKKILLIGANGYVGSNLLTLLNHEGYDVQGVDNNLRKSQRPILSHVLKKNYQDLSEEFLRQFTDCIWLSGHSSVVQASSDSKYALKNNLIDLIDLINKFKGRFIYASSGSVYSRKEPELCSEQSHTFTPLNMYDYTKISFDNYITSTNVKAIGLRFGTINGPGTNIKKELMLNSMVLHGLRDKIIKLKNPNFYRPILGINDLLLGLLQIINSDIQTGIYNMSSFNSMIGDLAYQTAKILDVEVQNEGESNTYNFMMDNAKFEQTFNYKFKESIYSIVESLTEFYNSNRL